MPQFLLKYLNALPKDQAETLWLWLDGTPDATSTMITAICERRGWGKPAVDPQPE